MLHRKTLFLLLNTCFSKYNATKYILLNLKKDDIFNIHTLIRFFTFAKEPGLFIVLPLSYYKLKSFKSQQISYFYYIYVGREMVMMIFMKMPYTCLSKIPIFINFRLPARIFCSSFSFFSKIRLVANLYVSYWAWHLINKVFTGLMSSDKFLSFLWHILISCNYEWSDLKRLLSHKITVNLYNLYLQGQNVFLWLEKLKASLVVT